MKNSIEVRATIKRLVFYSDQTNYMVARVDAAGESDLQANTVVGNIANPMEGCTYVFSGNYVDHEKYGRQFSAVSAVLQEVKSEDEIKAVLLSGIIKGVGEKRADIIIEAFGEKTLDIIENDYKKLEKLGGISKKLAKEIHDYYIEHKEEGKILGFLQNIGFGVKAASSIYELYGKHSIEKVKKDPYSLIKDIDGIGFLKVDKTVANLGLEYDSEKRVRAGILHIIENAGNLGHCYLPQEELVKSAAALLGVDYDIVTENLLPLAATNDIFIEEGSEGRRIYPFNMYTFEENLAVYISKLSKAETDDLRVDINNLIDEAEVTKGIRLSPMQRKAVSACMEESISIITGGPGTGKTTIIYTILSILKSAGKNVEIAAPTGRAAMRITETSSFEAKTIHRLLEYGGTESGKGFARNAKNPLECDALIVDEASMVDAVLAYSLFRAIKPGTRIIVVGDSDQLPSVGAGNVLADLINSGVINVIRLTEIFRQNEKSMIVQNAHAINNREFPICNTEDGDFFFLERGENPAIINVIMNLCKNSAKRNGYNPMQDFQVLCIQKKGECGTENLNSILQNMLNPKVDDNSEINYFGSVFRLGDKVMHIKNNYDLKWHSNITGERGCGIFNGEIGNIVFISRADDVLAVEYTGGRVARYSKQELKEIQLAYAITVHKSQGNEFPVVIMPVVGAAPMLATKNLLYTAVTRAKDKVVLIGKKTNIFYMLKNNFEEKRYSALAERLRYFSEVTS